MVQGHILLAAVHHVYPAMLATMDLHAGLHLKLVADHVLMDICAPLDQLTNTEELLQADLDLALIYALLGTSVQVLHKPLASLENILQRARKRVHCALLERFLLRALHRAHPVQWDTILRIQALHHVRSVLQEVMALRLGLQPIHAVELVMLDICAPLDRLTSSEELLQADLDLLLGFVLLDIHVQVLHKPHAPLEDFQLLGRQRAAYAVVEDILPRALHHV